MLMPQTYRIDSARSNYYTALDPKQLKNEWCTPTTLFDALDERFGPFELDAAANEFNTRCIRFNSFMEPDKHPWQGRVFCNPPYSGSPRLKGWVEKAFDAACHGATVVMVLPAQINSSWFNMYAPRSHVIVPKGRIQFVAPPGVKASRAMHESIILVFDPKSVRARTKKLSAECWDIKG